MIEEENRTSLLTQHNLEDNEDAMDALEELYSIKTLEKRERRLSKTKFDLQTSRKTEGSTSDDFVKMLFQSEQQCVSWDLLALLKQYKNLVMVGVLGRSAEILRFMQSLTGEKFDMPTDPLDCLQFSRRWKLPDLPTTDCCFVVRCCNRKYQWESCINDVVFSVLPQFLVVLEGNGCDVEQITQLCRNNQQLTKTIMKVEQSLLVRTARMGIDQSTFTVVGANEQRFNLFEEVRVVQLNAHGQTSSFLESQHYETRQMLERCIKHNHFSVVSTQPVAHYYFVLSLWTHFKRLSPPSDDMFGRSKKSLVTSPSNVPIDVGALTNIYLQIIEKQLRYSYKVRAEEYLKESRDEFMLYQCLKQEKQACLHNLKRYCYFLKAEKTKLYGRLCQFIKDTELEVIKRNESTNYRRNIELAGKCALTVNYKIGHNIYRSSQLDQFEQDFDLFLQSYHRDCIGKSSGYALSQYLKELVPQIYRYFDGAIKDEIKQIVENRHLSVPQEGLHERIVMTEGLLFTLEKDIVDIETRRLAIEKARKKKYKESYETKEVLRQTKDQIQKLKRMVSNDGQLTRRMEAASSVNIGREEKKKKKSKKNCSLI